LDEGSIARIRKLYDVCKSLKADIIWGRGSVTGSFSPKWTAICPNAAPFSVYANGKLEMHFGSMHTSDAAEIAATQLTDSMKLAGFTLPDDYLTTWFAYEPGDWIPKVDPLIAAVEHAVTSQPKREHERDCALPDRFFRPGKPLALGNSKEGIKKTSEKE
jgi:hypothetical protein